MRELRADWWSPGGGAESPEGDGWYACPAGASFCTAKRRQKRVKGDRFPLDEPLSVACSAGYEFRFFWGEKSKSVLRTDTLPR